MGSSYADHFCAAFAILAFLSGRQRDWIKLASHRDAVEFLFSL